MHFANEVKCRGSYTPLPPMEGMRPRVVDTDGLGIIINAWSERARCESGLDFY